MGKERRDEQGLSRRVFLKHSLVTGAAAYGGFPLMNAFVPATAEAASNTQMGEWKPATCQGCTSWCAKQVYVINGRAVKVRGNPHSKVNLGAGCPRSHFGLQQVYDPDRIKTPMKRTNPVKGRDQDPKFVPISWDEALDTIADKIMELRNNHETEKYMLMRGRYSYMRDILYDSMTKIIGSPNNISHSALCAEAEKFGPYFTEGLWDYRQYDVENTNYILLWGADPLSANRQVSYYSKAWGLALDKATVAIAEPRLSSTACKADEWLPVEPGQDGAVASAMAHVILTEGLWYKPFVGDFIDGVNQFKEGAEVSEESFKEVYTYGLVKWWNLELKDKTPEWAAKKAGIPAEQIRRVAIGFGKAAPHAMSWVGGGPVMQVRGGYGCMATHALNGLVGSVDNIGGTLAPNKVYTSSFPKYDEYLDDTAQKGKKHGKIDHRGRLEFPALNKGKSGGGVVTNNAAEGIINADPNEIKVAIAYMNNFNFSAPQGQRWDEALKKIPFLTHITTNASEFSWFADIVLPDTHHMFEKWGYVKSHGHGYRHVPLMQPIIDMPFEFKIDETEIPFLLGKKLAERGFDNLHRYHVEQFKDPETGKAPSNEGEFAEYALKIGTVKLWDPAKWQGGDKINGWEEFKRIGVSNSDPYPYRKRWGKMKTATGMFEFYSETLKKALEKHAEKHGVTVDQVMEATKYEARGELAFVPHYEEPYIHGDSADFPLLFVDHKSRLNREGRSANCPWYYELKDLDPGDENYADVAKLNPIDAGPLGLKDGDAIRIVSPVGTIECTAKLWEGVRPGTVAKCYGQGHWAYGHLASKEFGKTPRGGNNNFIIPADYDRLSGASAYYGTTRVRIEKA
ncbi:MAG: molybdopterin-dependent oxidoreductase [Pseudodesulfovibrio sp.]|uniref:molybdopterin-dependent oxidoreductase n=1 Tax=Pseudodesulfovibrio sp. TaxID=2035812 RepID=UPI003D12EF9A